MVNYANGKIYKIEPICEYDEGDIYVGSTTKQYLSQRMEKHRYDYKYWKEGDKFFLSVFNLFDKYGIENCQIILLEHYPCESKDELQSREGYYIRTTKNVNKCIMGRTKSEYYQENKDRIKAVHKKYNEANKDKIAQQCRKYRLNNLDKCNAICKEYRKANIDTIRQKDRERNALRRLEKFTCECGSVIVARYKNSHCKTIKHQNYLNSTQKPEEIY